MPSGIENSPAGALRLKSPVMNRVMTLENMRLIMKGHWLAAVNNVEALLNACYFEALSSAGLENKTPRSQDSGE